MLWSANWNRSCCNVGVNILYHTTKQPRNVLKKCFGNDLKRVNTQRLGNSKCAAKDEKQISFSPWMTNSEA